MKILLFGEFSALHLNLKEGLKKIGYDAVIVSSGDGWKDIPSDIAIPHYVNGIKAKILNRLAQHKILKSIKGYNVVQLINPFLIPRNLYPWKSVFNGWVANNDKVFLLAAGSDSYYWKNARTVLRYSPLNDCLKYDIGADTDFMESKKAIKINEYMANNCSGVIPVMYDYEVCYQKHSNLRSVIPLPINNDKINYTPNKFNRKLVVFHGLNRYGFKGTKYVEQAFSYLENKYPNDLSLIIKGKMPLNEYLELMRQTNIVIDQTNSYSCGMNALYALAMGKIVLGGAEPESLKALGVNKSPVFNITPSANEIIKTIEFLMDQRNNLEEMGFESRKYVEQVHGYERVAQLYLKTWTDKRI